MFQFTAAPIRRLTEAARRIRGALIAPRLSGEVTGDEKNTGPKNTVVARKTRFMRLGGLFE